MMGAILPNTIIQYRIKEGKNTWKQLLDGMFWFVQVLS